MSGPVRFVVAFLLVVASLGGEAAIIGVRWAEVEQTTFAPVTPGRPDPELAKTNKHRELTIEDRRQWVYPVAAFVGVFGFGLAQLALTHRPRARPAAAPADDAEALPEPDERYPNPAAPID
jgi:hypothetical protein